MISNPEELLQEMYTRARTGDYQASEKECVAVLEELRSNKKQEYYVARCLVILGMSRMYLGKRAESHSHFMEALDIYARCGEEKGKADTLFNLGIWNERFGFPEESIKCYTEAESIYTKLNNLHQLVPLKHNKALVYSNLTQYELAYQEFMNVLSLNAMLEKPHSEAMVRMNLGLLYSRIGDYSTAMEHLVQAVGIARNDGNPKDVCSVLQQLGIVLGAGNQHEESREALLEAEAIAQSMHDTMMLASVLNNLAVCYISLKQEKKGFATLNKVLEITRKSKNTRSEMIAMLNIALMYKKGMLQAKDSSFIAEQLQQALAKAREIHAERYVARIITELSDLVENSDELLQEALQTAVKTKEFAAQISCLERLYARAKEQGNFQAALEYHEQLFNAKSTAFNEESEAKYKKLLFSYRIQTIENERTELRRENEQLKNDVKQFVQRTQEHADFIAAIKKELRATKKQQEQSSNAILSLLDKHEQQTERERETFAETLNANNREFMTRLSEEHTALSHTELKVCSYLRMQLSSKEIAQLMFVSARAIEKHRLNIRKKMNLPRDVDLSAYIARL